MSGKAVAQRKTGYDRLRPLLFKLEPETAHKLTLRLLQLLGANFLGTILLRSLPSKSAQPISLFGLELPNRLGLAAGYDKDGLAYRGLARLGFGHLELGTVTLTPQAGRESPRVFRLTEDRALINRMGFPNQGAAALLRRLKRRKPSSTVIGVNVGKGADTPIVEAASDYVRLIQIFHPVADYITINVSSPNTLGLRNLQSQEYLQNLLGAIRQARVSLEVRTNRRVPILVKLAPDLSDDELEDAISEILSAGMDGVIATNTTVDRKGLVSEYQHEGGGLSGKPLHRRACDIVRKIHLMTSGALPIIGVGGIFSGKDATAMLESGASLVQIYTGLVYQGPGVVREILQGLE